MDVGAPSNFERLGTLPEDPRDVRVELVDDETIRARIRADYQALRLRLVPAFGDGGRSLCPLAGR